VFYQGGAFSRAIEGGKKIGLKSPPDASARNAWC
jgi:hypothetical protein